MIITVAAFEGDYHHHPLGWLVTVISAASTTRKVSEEGEGVFEGKILNLDSILSFFLPQSTTMSTMSTVARWKRNLASRRERVSSTWL